MDQVLCEALYKNDDIYLFTPVAPSRSQVKSSLEKEAVSGRLSKSKCLPNWLLLFISEKQTSGEETVKGRKNDNPHRKKRSRRKPGILTLSVNVCAVCFSLNVDPVSAAESLLI